MIRDSRCNILFVQIQLSAAGSEHVVLDLARRLDRSRFRVYIATFFGGELEKDFKQVCERIFHVNKANGVDFAAMLTLSRIIREMRIDLVNAHHYMPFVYSFLGSKVLNKRIALVYTEHSEPEIEKIAGLHRYLFNILMYRTDTVVGVSKRICETLKERFPLYAHKMASIVNGIDVDRFKLEIDRREVRRKWGFTPEHFVIGSVANFRNVKNHVCLIRAFNRIRNAHPETRLFLVGRGRFDDPENSENTIHRLIGELELDDRVVLAGYQSNIPEILRVMDVFCLSSFSEGLPISILESMAAEVPVIGSDVRGINEVISPNDTGLLFPSNDHEVLAMILELVIKGNSLRDRLVKRAHEFVSGTHGIQSWVSQYETLFKNLILKNAK